MFKRLLEDANLNLRKPYNDRNNLIIPGCVDLGIIFTEQTFCQNEFLIRSFITT